MILILREICSGPSTEWLFVHVNLEMLVFEERGNPEYPEKNLSEERGEPTTNSTHILRPVRESIISHIGGEASALTTAPSLLVITKREER